MKDNGFFGTFICLFLVVFLLTGCAYQKIQLASEAEKLVRVAINEAVPGNMKAEISAYKMSEDKVRLVISAHLLNDALPSSTSPYVRGSYTTNAKLTSLATDRCAKVMQNIINQKFEFEVGQIVVNVNHGVRLTTVYRGSYRSSSTKDVAMTLIIVSLNIKEIQNKNPSISEIQNTWRVKKNIINSISIVSGY